MVGLEPTMSGLLIAHSNVEVRRLIQLGHMGITNVRKIQNLLILLLEIELKTNPDLLGIKKHRLYNGFKHSDKAGTVYKCAC